MNILYIAEGDRDECLATIITSVGSEAVNGKFPVRPDRIDRFIPRRKRGFGGVVDALKKLKKFIETGKKQTGLTNTNDIPDIIVAILDNGAKNKKTCAKLIDSLDGVFGVSIEEFEAWILGDRDSLRHHLNLQKGEFNKCIGAGYRPEQDKKPKAKLDDLCELSTGYPWDANQSVLLAEQWRDSLDLNALRSSCPEGFAPFADRLRHRIQAAAGLLQM